MADKTKKVDETHGSSELFDEAFNDAEKLVAYEASLAQASGQSLRAALSKSKSLAEARLRRRTKRHQDINKLTSQYIGQHEGEVSNISDLLDYLRANGIEIVQDHSEGRSLTERAVRMHLKKVFGIEGKPGRKPQ